MSRENWGVIYNGRKYLQKIAVPTNKIIEQKRLTLNRDVMYRGNGGQTTVVILQKYLTTNEIVYITEEYGIS